MKLELLHITPDAERLIELAGRTCYKSEVSDETIIKRWVASGHESVLEHCTATFRVSECSRSLTHQLVRHRAGFAFSQMSQRYVEQDFDYVVPESIINNDIATSKYVECMQQIKNCYQALLDLGIKKEDARFVLPNSCHTEIVVTANFRAWRNFLKLRLDKHAQWEIRELANSILEILKNEVKYVFDDFMIDKQ